MTPFWLTAFLDFAPEEFSRGTALWQRLTGYGLSASRGEHREFASLLPPEGDDYLRVQRLGEGHSRIHLDVHVEEPRRAAAMATSLGARTVADHGYVVMRSPGGFPFCLVSHRAQFRPEPTVWPTGHTSLLDQICLDIPDEHWVRETTFWAALTGWELQRSPVAAEFASLVRPPGIPLRMLFQRLGRSDGEVTAHLDFATTDRSAETARHVAAGAYVLRRFDHWTVLHGSVGTTYCITDRDPRTGAGTDT